MRALAALLLGLSLLAPAGQAWSESPSNAALPEIPAAELPAQARAAIALIHKSGPFAYERDGAEFRNFEKRLPVKARGYYREYTVRTPGTRDRGARRIVAGKGGELYYTDDHYRSFRRIREE